MGSITIEGDGIQIKIKGESQHFFGQDLYTRAVQLLICDADVHGWEKHNLEHNLEPSEALSNFCAAVLVAVTRLWANEGMPDDEVEIPGLGKTALPFNKPAHEVLSQLIGELRQNNYLNDEIGELAEEFDDEFEDLNEN
jgi:hypothetical protein